MRRGLTIVEVSVVLLSVAVVTGLALPSITAMTCDELKNVSIRNLQQLNIAHVMYAIDWNDRQFTLVRADLGDFGSSPSAACQTLADMGTCHAPVILGSDCDGFDQGFFFGCKGGGSCLNFPVAPPINFPGWPGEGIGSFRISNAQGINNYVNGRFFDPVFYAPKDAVYEEVAPLFGKDCDADIPADLVFSSSYAYSPAAMFHPDVLSENDFHDFYTSPFDLPAGFESPTVSQALHPTQKTRIIEHSWLQRPPEPCNPSFAGDCVPYFFNHGQDSQPMTLFFDGHIASLSPSEAMQSERRILHQNGDPLWSRDTPFGSDGYFVSSGWDFSETSYHILTIDGIRGRDTVK